MRNYDFERSADVLMVGGGTSDVGAAVGGDDGLHGLELDLKKKTVYVNYSDGPTAGLMPYSDR